MGSFLAKGVSWLGDKIGDAIGGKTGNVFRNIFQFWGNGIRVMDDIMSVMSLGTLGEAEQGIAAAAKISVGGAAGASGIVPDMIRGGSGLVRLLQNPAREDSINSWYDEKVDPYLSDTPFGRGGWQSVLAGFQPPWLSPLIHAGREGKLSSSVAPDLAFNHMRRWHDLQIRAAGDLIAINQLQNIRDQARRYNNALSLKRSSFFHRVQASAEQLAAAREIWGRALPKERERISGSVSEDLKAERKALAEQDAADAAVFKRDPSARIVGPGFIMPRANVVA